MDIKISAFSLRFTDAINIACSLYGSQRMRTNMS